MKIQNTKEWEKNLKKHFAKKFKINIKNIKWFLKAFTHNSYSNEYNLKYNYQKLEFVGDAIIQKFVSVYLYHTYNNSHLNEGMLTVYRSNLVNSNFLSDLITHYDLFKWALMGRGEAKETSNNKNKILSDIYEALVAAIYFDQGEKVVDRFLNMTLVKYANQTKIITQNSNYKSVLQEYLQILPDDKVQYQTIKKEKRQGNWYFEVQAVVNNIVYGIGSGSSLKIASQEAAKNSLDKLKILTKNFKK